MRDVSDDILDPGTAGIDQRAGGMGLRARRVLGRDLPQIAQTLGPGDAGAGQDRGATRLRIPRSAPPAANPAPSNRNIPSPAESPV